MGLRGDSIMAVQDHRLSSLLMAGTWLHPDELTSHALYDYEMGGIALNDPTEGLRVQVWNLWLQGDDVVTRAPSYGSDPATVLFTDTGITELSLAFDQNMNPFVAYVKDGDAKWWWFDTFDSQTKHSFLPSGSVSPRCCMDDKRETQTAANDILLAYVRNNNLYYREQRDRYGVEYLKRLTVDATIIRLGMNHVNRVQYLMQGLIPEEFC